ncbi:hypothetical protein PQX77_013932 [Marasmius sp. AFHP31]|nr:hypothetical protein PQX77_013932 [Marasmius sp. AFHP31]
MPSRHLYQLEQRTAALSRELAQALSAKQSLTVEKVRADLQLRVYEKLVLSLRKTMEISSKRIEALDLELQKAGEDLAKIRKLKHECSLPMSLRTVIDSCNPEEKDDIINSLTRKTIFLAREALKGKRISFLRVLPDLRLLMGRLRFEIQSISGLLTTTDNTDVSSILANNGSRASLESSYASTVSSAANRAINLSDSLAQFLDEYEYLANRVGGDVSEDTSVMREVEKHSKGRIPPIEALMRRVRSRVAELSRQDPANTQPTPFSLSPTQTASSSNPASSVSPSSSTLADLSSDGGSTRSRPPYRRMVSPINHVRITAAKMVHFGVGDSERSNNWRSRG